jgi:hypothetical protein
MSFRQNNETNRRWNAFYQANKVLIEGIGLPGSTVDSWDRFAFLLMHGDMYPYDAPLRFAIKDLSSEKLESFRLLVDRYFEAGFHDPGMPPALVGGENEYLELARKYPGQFLSKLVESFESSVKPDRSD